MTNSVIQKFLVFVFFGIVASGCALEDDPSIAAKKDIAKPTLTEVTAVTTPTSDNTPNYTFNSTESGTITYGGSCSSSTTSVTSGNNTITLNTLSEITYSDCTITITDTAGNVGNTLKITSFTVDLTASTLVEVTAVTTPTNDNTPDYTFSSSEAGTITYGGSCSSSTTSVDSENKTITLASLGEGTYSDCTINVTDNASNVSDNLTITSFEIDTTSPTLTEVTAVTTPDNDTTPDYTFSSDSVGTITYGGRCSSNTSSSISGNNTITLVSLIIGAYSDCTITVTDSAGNISDNLTLTSFFVGNELSLSKVVTTLAGLGINGTLDGIGTLARFDYPVGITSDGSNLYVSDRYRIRQIVISTGSVTTLAGSGSAGSSDGTGTSASFYLPYGITTNGTNLYSVDFGSNLIRQIVISTGSVTTLAGSGSAGSSDGTGTSASFDYPRGITTDGRNLYVSDYNNHLIRQIVFSTGVVTTLAGTGSSGSTNGTGTSASFYHPEGITTDGTNLYLADKYNHQIRQIVISTRVVSTLAGSGTSLSVDGTGTSSSFSSPIGITTDGRNLYVTDESSSTIRKVVISTGVVTTLAGTGSIGSLNDKGTSASFYHPHGITTDGTNLYVADKKNFLIRQIE